MWHVTKPFFGGSVDPLSSQALPQPAAKPAMVAWFKSEDANPHWKSVVGKWEGRVAWGGVSRKVESGNGAGRPVTYISGNTRTAFVFGGIMGPDYSICSVTRYLGGQKGRILQSSHWNWLHGHWAGHAGVAHYGTWITPSTGPRTNDWLVTLGSPVFFVLPVLASALFHLSVTNTKKGYPYHNDSGILGYQGCVAAVRELLSGALIDRTSEHGKALTTQASN